MIYAGCFLLSVLSCEFALQMRGHRYIRRFFILLSVMLPVLLAGLRATSIGTDVEYYLVGDFRIAGRRSSFFEYITSYTSSRELLYMIIVYVVNKTTGNINVVLFIFEMVTIVGIYVGLYKHRNVISVPFAYAVFLLLFYHETLNLMRQWMSLAIMFAGVDNVERKRYWKFIPYVAVAALLHTTALIALVLIPMHYILYHSMHGQRPVIKMLFLLGIGGVCLFIDQLLRMVINFGLLARKYLAYVNRGSVSGHNIDTVLVIVEIVLLLIYNRRLTMRVPQFSFYKYNTYLFLLFLQLARVMYYGDRFGATFRLMNVLTLCTIPHFTSDRRERQLFFVVIFMVCLVYWWYMYIYIGNNATYPYLFA